MDSKHRYTIIFTIVGILVGIPLSYYFQHDLVQTKLTLGEYLKNFFEILSDDSADFVTPVFLSSGICALIGGFVGYFIDQKNIENAKPNS